MWKDRPFSDVRCHEDRLTQPLRWRKSRRIGVSFMGDLFHQDVPDEFVDRVFGVMAACEFAGNARGDVFPWHTFFVLTKRPERMRTYMSRERMDTWARMAAFYGGGLDPDGLYDQVRAHKRELPNVWLGVSVEDQATADERVPILLQTPAAHRWVSAEPLLGPLDLRRYLGDAAAQWDGSFESSSRRMAGPRLDWVVVGGES